MVDKSTAFREIRHIKIKNKITVVLSEAEGSYAPHRA